MKKTFLFYGLKLMMLLALSIPVLTSCGGGDDDEVGGGSSSGNSGGSGSESGGEGGGGNPDDPEVTISLTAANLTDNGYFDGLLYYKVTSNSPQEVTVNMAEKTATKVVIPSRVEIEGKTYHCTSIFKKAFSDCTELNSITIPSSIKEIGEDAFQRYSSRRNVYISDLSAWCRIKFAGSYSNPLNQSGYLYIKGKEIKDLEIPDDITIISNYAFVGCKNIESVVIPQTVSSIDAYAFQYCALKSVNIPSSVTRIGNNAFYLCHSLTSLTIPESVTSIGYAAFSGCSELTSIVIPNSLKEICDETFRDCSNLQSVTLPNSIIKIGDAFKGCVSLKSIVIPSSVTSIGSRAFESCESLKKIYCECTTPPSVFFSFYGCRDKTLIVPPGTLNNYLTAEFWKEFGTIIEGFAPDKDKQPVSITLQGVPESVLIGMSFSSIVYSISGKVVFEDNLTKVVEGKDLQFQDTPDMNQTGAKTLTAIYNKTYNGEKSDKTVTGHASFEVRTPLVILGATDNSTPFWEAHTDNIKVKPGETKVSTFINYTRGANTWENFLIVLCTADQATEYAVLRADGYGWGDGYENYVKLTPKGGQDDREKWLAAMNGATVRVSVTNHGNGTADVKIIMFGTDGKEYHQDYEGIRIYSDDFYYHFTVERCHLVFE